MTRAMDSIDQQALIDRFSAAMDRLGPFEPCLRLAVAVSGGADSMALALLAHEWVSRRSGTVIALTVDHGLRPEAGSEADRTLTVLAARGIPGRKLTVTGLARGAALAERAREARYRLLLDACATGGILHLLLGHHRGDQVETVMMRALSASGGLGLAGMSALVESRFCRMLRPLLDISPGALRTFLSALGAPWVEDPSNRDLGSLRVRLRSAQADPLGTGQGSLVVAKAARTAGTHRAKREDAMARTLAARATVHPEGYALLSRGPIDPDSLAALLRTIAGTAHAPPIDRVAALARDLRPTTLGGVRLLAAGRLGSGWLLVRETRGLQAPVAAHPNAIWDGRFRLAGAPSSGFPPGLTLEALGAHAAQFNDRRGPPAAVLHGLPALCVGGTLIAAPHIGVGYPSWRIVFDPGQPAAGAPFAIG
ncbi:MAG: tRNA lysidine(34) synthetase TilS [Acetobacteraceae bacterium]|nr:tRNA lysidine(34) synthetase TilS [Acetobacteraceae bacterium]